LNSLHESAMAGWQLVISGDPVLAAIVLRSLSLSASATLLACMLGAIIGSWLAVARFSGRALVLAILNTLLSLPSVVVGLVVYLLLSRSGPLGFLGWLYSFKAMLLAQTVLILPIVVALVRQVVEDAYAAHGEQLRSLGASPRLCGLLLAWDERAALLTVALAAFGRAIAEVGAVMLVGGNIDGFTRVMTTSIALETSKGDLPLAFGLGLVLLAVVLLLQGMIAIADHFWVKAGEGRPTSYRPAPVGTA
jgi:tungstate transport system permease protein